MLGAAFALAFAACWSPAIASACQITVSGSQPGLTNSAAVDCISIENANVAGDIANRGSVLQNGITIRNSVVNGTVSNIGPFGGGSVETIVGGISADSKSFIGGGAFPGIEVTAVPSFAGGINTDATIPNGIYVFDVQMFAGGVPNGGNTSGFSISGISHFSGGVTNSGQINFSIPAIIFEVPDFAGGVFNSGAITSTGFSRSGIIFSTAPCRRRHEYWKDFRNRPGARRYSFRRFDLSSAIRNQVCGRHNQQRTIKGMSPASRWPAPLTFSGAIVNSGTISGRMGLLLFDGGLGGGSAS